MLLSRFRMWIQLASTMLSNGYVATCVTRTVNTNPLKGVCVPYLNCYACPSALFSCPIGTLQHFMANRSVPYLLISSLSIIGLTIGRMPCGWACPFGFFQDLMFKIRSSKIKFPAFLRPMKYMFLVVFALLLPYFTGDNWFSMICPMGTLSAGIPWVAWNPINPATGQPALPDGPGTQYVISLCILVFFLILFVVTRRPFCKGVCPLGAILAMFNRVSLVRLEVAKSCDGCNVCNSTCPMDLDVPLEIHSAECIRCFECTRCNHVKIVSSINMETFSFDNIKLKP